MLQIAGAPAQLRCGKPSAREHDATVHIWCRYEGKDWRNEKSWDCDGDREVLARMESNFAALQDAMFIPGKEGVLQTSDELVGVAQAYERWMEQQVCFCPVPCSCMSCQAITIFTSCFSKRMPRNN